MSYAFALLRNFLCYNCKCKTETKQILKRKLHPQLSYTFHHRGTADTTNSSTIHRLSAVPFYKTSFLYRKEKGNNG